MLKDAKVPNPTVGFEKYDYDKEAKVIAKCLSGDDTSYLEDDGESRVVAICGPWGSGKTVFAQKVLDCIDENVGSEAAQEAHPKQTWTMCFEPWAFETSSQLIINFFQQLNGIISDIEESVLNDSDIDDSEDAQTEALESINAGSADGSQDNPLNKEFFNKLKTVVNVFAFLATGHSLAMGFGETASFATVLEGIAKILGLGVTAAEGIGKWNEAADEDAKCAESASSSDKDLRLLEYEDQKEELKECLEELGHRIVVCIDNVDRLRQEQIRIVFTLVAAVADFPSISYLLVLDDTIVCKALSSVHGCEGDEKVGRSYLEKIVNLWYRLPSLKTSVLVENLMQSIQTTANLDFNPFEKLIPNENYRNTFLGHLVRSPRVAERLRSEFKMWTMLGRRNEAYDTGNWVGNFIECYLSIYFPRLHAEISDDRASTLNSIEFVANQFRAFLRGQEESEDDINSDNGQAVLRWMKRHSDYVNESEREPKSIAGLLGYSQISGAPATGRPDSWQKRAMTLAICCYLLDEDRVYRNKRDEVRMNDGEQWIDGITKDERENYTKDTEDAKNNFATSGQKDVALGYAISSRDTMENEQDKVSAIADSSHMNEETASTSQLESMHNDVKRLWEDLVGSQPTKGDLDDGNGRN